MSVPLTADLKEIVIVRQLCIIFPGFLGSAHLIARLNVLYGNYEERKIRRKIEGRKIRKRKSVVDMINRIEIKMKLIWLRDIEIRRTMERKDKTKRGYRTNGKEEKEKERKKRKKGRKFQLDLREKEENRNRT